MKIVFTKLNNISRTTLPIEPMKTNETNEPTNVYLLN